MSKNSDILTRRVEKVLPTADGLTKLMQKRKIRLYQGFDPTGTRLHLGHAVGLKKLMEFAEAGHEVIFLFGTGTVIVGDPSQRDTGRKLITQDEIDENIKDWQRQASKIVDFKKVTIKKNGDWLLKLNIKDIVHIASHISSVQLFKRESFQRRLDKGDTVWYHETMYPLLQGYDSVVMDVDLEIGGSDQEFNMLMGRELQKKMNNREKYVLTTPMIVGTDGKQMSKSSGNCVWLDDEPNEMYGKLMRLPDSEVISYFTNVTDVSLEDLETLEADLKTGKNPRDIKARLASEVVTMLYSQEDAKAAVSAFDAQFKDGNIPANIPEIALSKANWAPVELLTEVKLVSSKSEARRILEQNGAKLNGKTLNDNEISVTSGDVLQVGKRKFVKIDVKA